jgi:hypothetical protein
MGLMTTMIAGKMMNKLKEIMEVAKEARDAQELDYSVCLNGGKVVNGEKLVLRMEAKLRDAIPLMQAAIDNIEYNITQGGFALEGEQELLNKLKEWIE